MRAVADQLGANLAYCRRRAKLSQEELAVMASLHRARWAFLPATCLMGSAGTPAVRAWATSRAMRADGAGIRPEAAGGPATKYPAWTKKWGVHFRGSCLPSTEGNVRSHGSKRQRDPANSANSGVQFRRSLPCIGRGPHEAAGDGDQTGGSFGGREGKAERERRAARSLPIAEGAIGNCPAPDSAAGRRSRLLRRARVFSHSNAFALAPDQSPPRAIRRAPARTSLARQPRYRLRAGSATLLRLGGCDRPRRDRDLLGAGEAALSHRRARNRAPAPRHSDHGSACAALVRSAAAGGSSGGGRA